MVTMTVKITSLEPIYPADVMMAQRAIAALSALVPFQETLQVEDGAFCYKAEGIVAFADMEARNTACEGFLRILAGVKNLKIEMRAGAEVPDVEWQSVVAPVFIDGVPATAEQVALLNRHLAGSGLPQPLVERLRNVQIYQVGTLVQRTLVKRDKIPEVGRSKIAIILEFLLKDGLRLGMHIEGWSPST